MHTIPFVLIFHVDLCRESEAVVGIVQIEVVPAKDTVQLLSDILTQNNHSIR